MIKKRDYAYLALCIIVVAMFASCVTYEVNNSYSRDVYLDGKKYEVVGLITVSTKLVYSKKSVGRGIKGTLVDAARKEYGNLKVDDVIDIKSVSRETNWWFFRTGRVDFEGVAIKYTDSTPPIVSSVDMKDKE